MRCRHTMLRTIILCTWLTLLKIHSGWESHSCTQVSHDGQWALRCHPCGECPANTDWPDQEISQRYHPHHLQCYWCHWPCLCRQVTKSVVKRYGVSNSYWWSLLYLQSWYQTVHWSTICSCHIQNLPFMHSRAYEGKNLKLLLCSDKAPKINRYIICSLCVKYIACQNSVCVVGKF